MCYESSDMQPYRRQIEGRYMGTRSSCEDRARDWSWTASKPVPEVTEAGRWKREFSLWASGGTQACWHLDFRLLPCKSYTGKYISVVRPQVHGYLVWRPRKLIHQLHNKYLVSPLDQSACIFLSLSFLIYTILVIILISALCGPDTISYLQALPTWCLVRDRHSVHSRSLLCHVPLLSVYMTFYLNISFIFSS